MNQNLIDNENLQSDRLKLQQSKKVKTNGDVIRESNEKLIEFMNEYKHGSKCNFCNGECWRMECCYDGLLNYLNQPIESEVPNE